MNRFSKWVALAVCLFAANQSFGSAMNDIAWTVRTMVWPIVLLIICGLIIYGVIWYIFLNPKRSSGFTANVEEMSFSRRGFELKVDQANQIIMVNTAKISPLEFSWYKGESTWDIPGGGAAVYNSSGTVVGHTGGADIEITRGYDVTFFGNGKKVRTEKFSRRAKRSHVALIEVLTRIDVWCKEVTKQKAFDALGVLREKAGIDKECKRLAWWDKAGDLIEAIAVDQAGKVLVVSNKGADTWVGTLAGASAQIVDGVLEFKVDDPAYRAAHMADRHFRLFKGTAREHLVEWESRINLLSKQAGVAA